MNKLNLKFCFAICLSIVIVMFFQNPITAYATEPVVIVIDPGHGGENLGAEYKSYTEKDMTMVVAKAMKEELEKYENVKVYLTHESIEDDLSLLERVEFAKEKNADFLFCLHFNMSVHHNLFGSEVWVSAFGKYYSKAYSFAEIEMQMLTDLGLYSRGIKTKLNDKGTNYYGILRIGDEKGIPTALIEHCHLDQANDQPFYAKSNEQLKEFGILDATAAAKYFRLSSEELGVNYSNYPVSNIPVPKAAVKPDQTAPDVSNLKLISLDAQTGEAILTLEAEDYDSYILYYEYSLDGGNTYSDLVRFPKEKKKISFQLTIPPGKDVELRANVYNGFDVWTESNIIEVSALYYNIEAPDVVIEKTAFVIEKTDHVIEKTDVEEIKLEDIIEQSEDTQLEMKRTNTVFIVIIAIIISLMILCLIILATRIILVRKKLK